MTRPFCFYSMGENNRTNTSCLNSACPFCSTNSREYSFFIKNMGWEMTLKYFYFYFLILRDKIFLIRKIFFFDRLKYILKYQKGVNFPLVWPKFSQVSSENILKIRISQNIFCIIKKVY